MCVNKTEAMHERPRINMNGEPHSTSTFTCSITYITSILLYALLYILRTRIHDKNYTLWHIYSERQRTCKYIIMALKKGNQTYEINKM